MVRPGDAIGMSTKLFSFLFLFLYVLSPLPNVWPFPSTTINTTGLSGLSNLLIPRSSPPAEQGIIAALAISLPLVHSSTAPSQLLRYDHPLHRLHQFSPCHRASTRRSPTLPPPRSHSPLCTFSYSSPRASLSLLLLIASRLASPAPSSSSSLRSEDSLTPR